MALTDLLLLTPRGNLGGIEIQASLEEILTDNLTVTEHPVELSPIGLNAAINDHAYKQPSEVVLRCGWSNSSPQALSGAISAVFGGGSMSAADYVSAVYSQLLALQESRVPFSITTSKRQYQSMLLVALQVTTDAKTSQALMVSATCKQVIIVETKATTLPPRSSQANPASTAEVENTGTAQAQPGTPSPGGAVAPENM